MVCIHIVPVKTKQREYIIMVTLKDVLAMRIIAQVIISINTPATRSMSCRTKNTNAATTCIRDANVKNLTYGDMKMENMVVIVRKNINTPVRQTAANLRRVWYAITNTKNAVVLADMVVEKEILW